MSRSVFAPSCCSSPQRPFSPASVTSVGGPAVASRIELGLFTSQRNGAVALLSATEAMPAAAPAVVA